MSDEIVKIDTFHLIVGYLMLIIPFTFFWYFKIKMTKSSIISVARMSIQLLLVGFYLESIFKLNSVYLNIGWVLVMMGVGIYTTIKQSKLKLKYFVLPLSVALFSSLLIILAFFLGLVIDADIFFDARYLIPIAGMILGNAINYNIVGLNSYFESIVREENMYYYLLVNTNDKKHAISPFIRSAITKAMNPLIGSMMVMGIISLPGMMTGQILGGSMPTTAIKYQILIAVAIFSAGTLNLALSIIFSNLFVFDKYGRLKREVVK